MNMLKHFPPRPFAVRSSPPSKNSETSFVEPPFLFAVSHGGSSGPVFGVFAGGQAASAPSVDLQFRPCATGAVSRSQAPPTFPRTKAIVPPNPPFVQKGRV